MFQRPGSYMVVRVGGQNYHLSMSQPTTIAAAIQAARNQAGSRSAAPPAAARLATTIQKVENESTEQRYVYEVNGNGRESLLNALMEIVHQNHLAQNQIRGVVVIKQEERKTYHPDRINEQFIRAGNKVVVLVRSTDSAARSAAPARLARRSHGTDSLKNPASFRTRRRRVRNLDPKNEFQNEISRGRQPLEMTSLRVLQQTVNLLPAESMSLKVLAVALYDAQKAGFVARSLLPIQLKELLIAQTDVENNGGLALILKDLTGRQNAVVTVSKDEIAGIRARRGSPKFKAEAVQGVLTAMQLAHDPIIDSINGVSGNAPVHMAFPVSALSLLSGEDLRIEAELTVRRWAEHHNARYGGNVSFSWYGSPDAATLAVLEKAVEPYAGFVKLTDSPEKGAVVVIDAEEGSISLPSDVVTLPTGKVQPGHVGDAFGVAGVGILTARSLPRDEAGNIRLQGFTVSDVTERNLTAYNLLAEKPISREEYPAIITNQATPLDMFTHRLKGFIPQPVDLGARLALLRITKMAA